MSQFLHLFAQTSNRGRVGVERRCDPVGRVTRIDVCMLFERKLSNKTGEYSQKLQIMQREVECKRAAAFQVSTDLDPPARVLALLASLAYRQTQFYLP